MADKTFKRVRITDGDGRGYVTEFPNVAVEEARLLVEEGVPGDVRKIELVEMTQAEIDEMNELPEFGGW